MAPAGRLTFVGCGDAFGSGGRFNTCMLVEIGAERFFVDFGGSSLIALKRLGIAYDAIDKILITHLHADHAGGLPSLLIEAMIVSRRTAPLTIAGPAGTGDWLNDLKDLMYPGSAGLRPRFDLEVIEMTPGRTCQVGALRVTPYPMRHTPQTHPTGLRVETGGKVFAYTGDSAWNDTIPALARGSDVFVTECYARDRDIALHMGLRDIVAHRDELDTGRLVLTHLGPDMLDVFPDIDAACARDGMSLRF